MVLTLHFIKTDFFTPINKDANLVVDSLHKTLPSMTGTALLHSDDTFNTAGTADRHETFRLYQSVIYINVINLRLP